MLELTFRLNTPTELHIGETNPAVIRLGNRRKISARCDILNVRDVILGCRLKIISRTKHVTRNA